MNACALRLVGILLGMVPSLMAEDLVPVRALQRPSEPITVACYDVVDTVSETHALTVHFQGEDFRPAFFDDGDLRVVGLGFEARPVFERWEEIRKGDVGYEAHYRMTAPEGGWSLSHNGTVEVWLESGQVERVQGALPAQLIDTFRVCLGEEVPLPGVRLVLDPTPQEGVVPCVDGSVCHRMRRVLVDPDRLGTHYVPQVEYEDRWDTVVQRDGNVWYVDLYQVPKGHYPFVPTWHPISQVFGGGFRSAARFPFYPPPGDYEFQVRSKGEVLAREAFEVLLEPKIRSDSSLVITAPEVVNPVVTFGYWHPDGVDVKSLGNDDLDLDASYTPGRLPPEDERVAFLGAEEGADGWLMARYQIASPPGGWSHLEKSFTPTIVSANIRTLTDEPFSERDMRLRGFEVRINEPYTGPVDVEMSRSALMIRDMALETMVTVNYTSEEPLDLTSIDIADLSVNHGFAVSVDFVDVQEDGREVTVEYRVLHSSELSIGTRIVIGVAAGEVATVSGQTTEAALMLGFLVERPEIRTYTVSPNAIRKASQVPFRFTIHYPDTDGSPFVPPAVDVVATWMREGFWETPHPPMPFRQPARIVNVFAENARDLPTVEYEITPPDIGWSHVLNGRLGVEIEGSIGKLPLNIAIPKPRVDASLEIEEAFPGVVAHVRVKTYNEPSAMAVTDWRMTHGEAGVLYLDATVSPLDVIVPGPMPEFYEQAHAFTLMNLQPPLAFADFAETEVILRVNGERVARETFQPKVPPSVAIVPSLVTLKASQWSVSLTVNLGVAESSLVVVNWGDLVITDDQNVRIEGAVFRVDPEGALAGGSTRLSRRYDFGSVRKEAYRAELDLNDTLLAESFYFGNATAFDSWRGAIVNKAGGLDGLIVDGRSRVLGDLDGDGFSDFEEYAFAGDLLDPKVRPKQGEAIEEGTGRLGVYFQWPWERGDLKFTLETSTDLFEWTTHRELTRSRWKSSVEHRVFLDEGVTAPFMRVRVESGGIPR